MSNSRRITSILDAVLLMTDRGGGDVERRFLVRWAPGRSLRPEARVERRGIVIA